MLNISNGIKRFVSFKDVDLENAIKALTYFNVLDFDKNSRCAIVEGRDFQYESLRDIEGFYIGCVQK